MMRQKLFLAVAGLLLCFPLFAKERIVLECRDYEDWWTRDDRSLSMCVNAFHDGRLVTVCSEKVLEDVSIRVRDAGVMCCRNRRGSRCPEAIPSCWKGMLKGRCP